MKYLWIIVLVIGYGGWTFSAIQDTVHFFKSKFNPEIKASTCAWVVCTGAILFVCSLMLWISDL